MGSSPQIIQRASLSSSAALSSSPSIIMSRMRNEDPDLVDTTGEGLLPHHFPRIPKKPLFFDLMPRSHILGLLSSLLARPLGIGLC